MDSASDLTLPLPAKGSIVSSIRQSCKDARLAANIQVHPESISALLKSPLFTETYLKLSQIHGVAMPLQFPTVASEINVISVLSILNFAHSYRVPLKKATGRGAYDTMRALIFGLYLSSNDEEDLLSAKGLKNLTSGRVAELMQLSGHLHIEQAHPTIPGLTIGQLGGPLYELVTEVTNVLNETGAILVTRGYPNLGEFVLHALKMGQTSEGGPVDPEVVLDEVIRAFPAFRDVGVYNGKEVFVFKKVLFMLHALVMRFGNATPPKIPLPDTSQLPIFSDNVIPSMLVHFGILDLSAANVPKLREAAPFGTLAVAANLHYVPSGEKKSNSSEMMAKGPELSAEEAYVMRAAAVDACEMIVEAAKSLEEKTDVLRSLDLPGLDGWLWTVAKEGRFRSDLSRFRQAGICVMY